jgi:hypothetical protein
LLIGESLDSARDDGAFSSPSPFRVISTEAEKSQTREGLLPVIARNVVTWQSRTPKHHFHLALLAWIGGSLDCARDDSALGTFCYKQSRLSPSLCPGCCHSEGNEVDRGICTDEKIPRFAQNDKGWVVSFRLKWKNLIFTNQLQTNKNGH